jgi:hypothetical protein
VAWCRSGFQNEVVDASVDELGIDLAAGRAWDLPLVTVTPFVAAGAGLFHQRFHSRGDAPTRTSALGHLDAGVKLSGDLVGKLYAALEVAAQTYFFRRHDGGDGPAADFTVAIAAGLGWHL